MVDFLDKYNILYENQYGFRPNYSTEYAPIQLSDKIARAIDDKKFMVGIFVDLSKAFDTLNHEILLTKLAHYGIRGIANDWFRSYLSNRKQCVSFNNILSAECTITTGVPQGSILGPLLFLLYINDICNSSSLLHFILYADDTNIFFSSKNIDELCTIVNMELRCVMQWFICNRLSVNIKKTNFVLFGNQAMLKNVTSQTRCKLFMGNIEIGQTNTAKFLGIIIDSNLTWKPHIDNVTKKVAKSVGIIKRVRHCLPVDTLNTLYNTLILPYINYCNIIWARNKVTKINKYTEQQQQSTRLHALFVLQKKIVRIITLSPYNSHALPLFKRLNQLTIYDINKLAVATFMYRYENNSLPQVFSGFFVATSAVHDHIIHVAPLSCIFCLLELT